MSSKGNSESSNLFGKKRTHKTHYYYKLWTNRNEGEKITSGVSPIFNIKQDTKDKQHVDPDLTETFNGIDVL